MEPSLNVLKALLSSNAKNAVDAIKQSLQTVALKKIQRIQQNEAKKIIVKESSQSEVEVAKKMKAKGYTTAIIFPKSSGENRAIYTKTVQQASSLIRTDFPNLKNYKILSIDSAIQQGVLNKGLVKIK
ncbi:MAG: hypothetical protein PHG29_14530 [Prolixibacteraceae bacterium]|nr:hypothetical protein [Prolixibacteraceae bacterium]